MEESKESGEEKSPGAETEAEGGAKFVFTSFREFLKFTEYVGDAIQIELTEPILDTAGAVLVQKSLHFRASMLKNLWKFFNQGNLNEKISVSDTKPLRQALRDKICRALFRCLEAGRFHVAQTLCDASTINIKAMLGNTLQKPELLRLFLKLDQQEDPIIPHLGEVALVAGGFAEQYFRLPGTGSQARETIRTAILAGLMHDISLADDSDFLSQDIEHAIESKHSDKSVQILKTLLPDINIAVTDVIEHHHRTGNIYDPETITNLNTENVATEAVALSEFIFVQLRSQYKKDEVMDSAQMLFYHLGRAFGQGKFHPQFKRIAAQLWESLYATLHYGFEIGKVENRCPYKPSAIAYPTPRCTQIMCHLNVSNCQHYDPQFPLEILQATRFPGRPGVAIQPGKYCKCKLAKFLPTEINKSEGAAAWLDKGGEKVGAEASG